MARPQKNRLAEKKGLTGAGLLMEVARHPPAGEAPHEIGRRRFGRITIANSDSAATA
jgi:hypothetical protein